MFVTLLTSALVGILLPVVVMLLQDFLKRQIRTILILFLWLFPLDHILTTVKLDILLHLDLGGLLMLFMLLQPEQLEPITPYMELRLLIQVMEQNFPQLEVQELLMASIRKLLELLELITVFTLRLPLVLVRLATLSLQEQLQQRDILRQLMQETTINLIMVYILLPLLAMATPDISPADLVFMLIAQILAELLTMILVMLMTIHRMNLL